MGFDKYLSELKDFMANFTEESAKTASVMAAKKRLREEGADEGAVADQNDDVDMIGEGNGGFGHVSKKLRREGDAEEEDEVNVEIVDIKGGK